MMIILNSFDDFLNPEHAKTPPTIYVMIGGV